MLPSQSAKQLNIPLPSHDEIVKRYAPWIHNIAKKLIRQLGIQDNHHEDLVSSGFQGLLEAYKRYNPSYSVPFESFAYYRVRGAMLDNVRKTAYLPRRIYAQLRAAEASDRMLEDVNQSAPHTPDESRDELKALMGRIAAIHVIAALGQDEQSSEPSDPESTLARKRSQEQVRQALTTLPTRERQLVEGFYFQGRAFDDIAKEIGISKSWASRLHNKALDILRRRISTGTSMRDL